MLLVPVSLKVGRGEVQGVFHIDGALLTETGSGNVQYPATYPRSSFRKKSLERTAGHEPGDASLFLLGH